jgi:hypothetical protein
MREGGSVEGPPVSLTTDTTNFGEPPQDEVRRIPLPRTPRVNRGKERKGGGILQYPAPPQWLTLPGTPALFN